MPGERRPAPRAADADLIAARARVADRLSRATARLDGLYALLGADDGRDAALLATLLAEDLDAVAAALGSARRASLVDDRAGLGPLPGLDVLTAFAHRAEAALDRLEADFAARKAGAWRLPEDRYEARALWRVRALLLLCVVFLTASILLGDVMARKRREFVAMVTLLRERAEASIALTDLAKMALVAKKAGGQPLLAVTGENCSLCGCEGRDLRNIPEGDVCRRKWASTLSRLGQAVEASPKALAGLARDPWGSPYLLNENEGESPDFPCLPDTVASAGQNGILGDADDIVVGVPNAFCPETR